MTFLDFEKKIKRYYVHSGWLKGVSALFQEKLRVKR